MAAPPDSTEFESWLAELIREFQTDLPPDLEFNHLVDFSDPTQMYAFVAPFGNGGIRFVIYVSHDRERGNGLTRAATVQSRQELADRLNEIEEYFDARALPPEYRILGLDQTEISQVAAAAVWFANRIDQPADGRAAQDRPFLSVDARQFLQTVPPGSLLGGRGRFPLPPASEALRDLGDPPRSTPRRRREAAGDDEDVPIAYGGNTDPPVWVGQWPRLSEKDRVEGLGQSEKLRAVTDARLHRQTIGDSLVSITRKGMVIVETGDPELALSLVNQVLAAMARSGLPQLAVSGDELIPIKAFDASGTVKGTGPYELTFRNNRFRHFSDDLPLGTPLALIDEAPAASILSAAAAASPESVVALRLLDASTLALRSHYPEAFIVAWTVVEHWIERTADDLWVGLGRTRKKIKETERNWTASLRLDLLLASVVIDRERFNLLSGLRGKRNKIVHDLDTASEEEARDCISAAHELFDLPGADSLSVGTVIIGFT